jgi:hypothetical protein
VQFLQFHILRRFDITSHYFSIQQRRSEEIRHLPLKVTTECASRNSGNLLRHKILVIF